MKLTHTLKRLGAASSRWTFVAPLIAAGLVLTACGGGGGAPLPAEAIVTAIASSAQVLEGQPGATPLLVFDILTSKTVERGLVVSFNTVPTANVANSRTGLAVGGVACDTGVDFIAATGSKMTIPAGANPADTNKPQLTIRVCPNSMFGPNKKLEVVWSSEGATGGKLTAIIINDDAGGLNATGATALLGGSLIGFGRDALKLVATLATSIDSFFGFSFNTSNNDCTVDNVTGLTWQKASTSSQTFANAETAVIAAKAFNSGAGLCGKTDWRVPTVNELVSLMDYGGVKGQPSINADAANAMTDIFWSSEQLATATSNKWTVSAKDGSLSYYGVGDSNNVRLVSGGEYENGSSRATACNTPNRYKDFKDGTVEDTRTGLMWKQCSEGATGLACTSAIPSAFTNPTDVTKRLTDVNAASATLGLGYSDWRIPNVKELASLVDRCAKNDNNNITIDNIIFPNTKAGSYISGTYDVADSSNLTLWFVDFIQHGGKLRVFCR